MPFEKKIETEIGTLGIWKLTDSTDTLVSKFIFTAREKVEFEKIIAAKRKIEYLASRLLVQKILNKKNEILYQESGKPTLKNQNLNISISHSADVLTVLVSEKNVGIDVEIIDRNVENIAKRFLHADELQHIQKSKNPQLGKILYWSAKESIFKCSPSRNIQFNKQIYISPFQPDKEEVFSGELLIDENKERFKLWYFVFENNVIAYCVERED